MVTRVLEYPGTQILVSSSSAAAQTLKREQIVYGNPGTRAPVSAGYPVPVPPQTLPTRSSTRFQILRPGSNSSLHPSPARVKNIKRKKSSSRARPSRDHLATDSVRVKLSSLCHSEPRRPPRVKPGAHRGRRSPARQC